MSKGNPRKAMAALLPLPIRCGCDVVVRPVTLGMWAALERIGSPIVTGNEPKDTLELVPSLYLVTHDPLEVFEEDIIERAMQWADTLPISALDAIRVAYERQIAAAVAVMPQRDELKKGRSAGTTAGSPRSSTGQPHGTTGASKRSSGARRSPRSAS